MKMEALGIMLFNGSAHIYRTVSNMAYSVIPKNKSTISRADCDDNCSRSERSMTPG